MATQTSKTVYSKTTTSNEYEYNPKISTRGANFIQRTSVQPTSNVVRSVTRASSYGTPNFGSAPGAYAAVTSSGVGAVKNSRVQEKKDMQDLNERFANYIEKVRFLEAQNRKLADELNRLKEKWGKETSAIKAMYQAELDEARKLLDDSEKEKARLEIRVATLEDTVNELRKKVDDLNAERAADKEKLERQNQQLSDYEAEINLLRRRIDSLESDRERDKKEIARLTDALNRARIDLDAETLNHIDAENRRQTLEEELEFMKQVHEQEMKELAALAYRDTTNENREFWKNEMAQCLREIQATYDEKIDLVRNELESFYNMKIQEFRTGATRQNMESVHAKEECKRLRQQLADLRAKFADLEARNAQLEKELELLRREYEDKEREWEIENTDLKNEIAKLRAEMEAILKELQDIMDTKLGLELEIAAYRKLLEGEENRTGLKQIVDSWITSGQTETSDDSSLKVSQVVKGEMSAKTTYQRSAKGPVTICECSPDGSYVTMENTGRKEENISGWRIVRTVDNKEHEKRDVSLPTPFTIRGGQKIKVFGKGKAAKMGGPNDIDCEYDDWGAGYHVVTKLVNPAGEDRATHTQRTQYRS